MRILIIADKYTKSVGIKGILLIGALVVLTILMVSTCMERRRFARYTVAKLLRFESAEQGGDLYLDVLFDRKWYHTKVVDLISFYPGDLYFVEVSSINPAVVYSVEDRVKTSIDLDTVPRTGWKRLPHQD